MSGNGKHYDIKQRLCLWGSVVMVDSSVLGLPSDQSAPRTFLFYGETG